MIGFNLYPCISLALACSRRRNSTAGTSATLSDRLCLALALSVTKALRRFRALSAPACRTFAALGGWNNKSWTVNISVYPGRPFSLRREVVGRVGTRRSRRGRRWLQSSSTIGFVVTFSYFYFCVISLSLRVLY